MKEHLVGFDIGGTKCAVVLGKATEGSVQVVGRLSFPTEVERGLEHSLTHLERCARSLTEEHAVPLAEVTAIGISCGGPLDSQRGLILGPPNLPGWDNVAIVSRYETTFGVPTRLQNDANACALAEWRWGAGRGCRDMAFLTFGTGMGAGLILNGRLCSGASGLAGEVGHVRLERDGPLGHGKRGSFEGFCSGGGMAELARQMVREQWKKGREVSFCRSEQGLDGLDARKVAEAARAGDPLATEIYAEVARYLGQGLAMLIDILNPEVIVIGGIFMRQRDLLWPVAEKVIAGEALPPSVAACRVVPAQLGEAIGDYASLAVAMGE